MSGPGRTTQHLLLALLGAVTLAVSLGDAHLAYVQAGFRPLLVLAGLVVLGVGLAGILHRAPRRRDVDQPHGSDGPRVGWLLFLPVAVLLVVAPGPLGAYTAARHAAPVVTEEADRPLGIGLDDPGEDFRTLSLTSYTVRTQQSDTSPLQDRQIRLVGFLSPREDGGWYVTRIRIACCAADALAVRVALEGPADDVLVGAVADQWIEVVGTYAPSLTQPSMGYPEPVLAPVAVQEIPPPTDGYQD